LRFVGSNEWNGGFFGVPNHNPGGVFTKIGFQNQRAKKGKIRVQKTEQTLGKKKKRKRGQRTTREKTKKNKDKLTITQKGTKVKSET